MSEVKIENENEVDTTNTDNICKVIIAVLVSGIIAFLTYINDVWEKPRFLYTSEQNSAVKIIDKLSYQVELGNYEISTLKHSYPRDMSYIKVLGININSLGWVIDAEGNFTRPFASLKDEYQRDVYYKAVEMDRRNGINKIFTEFEVEVIEVN